MEFARGRIREYQLQLKALHPKNQLLQKRQYLTDLEEELERQMQEKLRERRYQVSLYAEKLKGLSPLEKLSQGFSHVADAEGRTVTDVNRIQVGELVTIHVKNGRIVAQVKEKEEWTQPKKSYRCQNLVIATGGCSYAGTGSDGKMLNILSRDLNIDIEEPRPVLTPVYVEDYEFKDLSGVSFRNIEAYIETEDGKRLRGFAGDLLFTSKTLSGPAILNNSRYMRPGMILSVNFLTPADEPKITERFKRDFPGNGRSPQTYMSENLGLPKRFAQAIACKLSVSDRKVSQITGKQMRSLSEVLTGYKFKIRKLGGFSEAMATGGGVSLCHKTSAVMEHEVHKGLYFIGEAVDVDGDTGGYNLPFAYSSAKAAAHNISAGEFLRGTKK